MTASRPAALSSERPDLVLLDIMMPGKSGFDVCRELKADESMRGTYVILLTAMGQDRDMEDGYQSGADEYMTKPFSPRSLRRRLHELLDEVDMSGTAIADTQDRRTIESLAAELVTVYEELSLLYSLSAGLGRLTSEDEVASAALREAVDVARADCGWFVTWDGMEPRISELSRRGISADTATTIASAVLHPRIAPVPATRSFTISKETLLYRRVMCRRGYWRALSEAPETRHGCAWA